MTKRDPAPVSTSEIAELLGVSRQRVDQLSREVGFPPVWRDLAPCRVWRDTEIEVWASTRGTRRGRPPRK